MIEFFAMITSLLTPPLFSLDKSKKNHLQTEWIYLITVGGKKNGCSAPISKRSIF